MSQVLEASRKMRLAIESATEGLVDRDTLVELVVLSAIAGEHVLVIGPPGTAKSEAIRRVSHALGGKMFEYLVGRFTEPSELFGPVDLRKLKDGIVETATANMLPEAEIAFLDEVFLGSTAILNTLLGILNERVFRRGHTVMKCPLRVCVGAANRLPEDEQLLAFADRFMVRCFVDSVGDGGIESLLKAGWRSNRAAGQVATASDLDTLTDAAMGIDLDPVRPLIAHGVRLLRNAGILLSDRRVVRLQKLVAAAAVLSGRTFATRADLWPMVFVLPTEETQTLGRVALAEYLSESANDTLVSAPLVSSLGPKARANKIIADANAAFAASPGAEAGSATELQSMQDAWKLRLEAIAREIDATFEAKTMPEPLKAVRERLVASIVGSPAAQSSSAKPLSVSTHSS